MKCKNRPDCNRNSRETNERELDVSKEKCEEDLLQHKSRAVEKMDSYLDNLIRSSEKQKCSKADKLSYWLEDWVKYLEFEPEFSPISLRRYKRGEIVKIHLGFNVGSEEGGLHYAVVLDRNNAKSSPVVTIVPLTSVKPHTDLSKLKKGSIFLGNELFTNLNSKISAIMKHLGSEAQMLSQLMDELDGKTSREELLQIRKRIDNADSEFNLFKKMQTEVSKMKTGSIALVNQITTISKIRIYDPKTDHDILSNIKLSNEKLDMIDNEIRNNFTNL